MLYCFSELNIFRDCYFPLLQDMPQQIKKTMKLRILILFLIPLTIALNAEDRFGTLLAVGITGMYLFHVLVNIGMTIGIMPVTGVPLPFLSYGVSSLTTNMLLAGVLLNINVRHTRLQF